MVKKFRELYTGLDILMWEFQDPLRGYLSLGRLLPTTLGRTPSLTLPSPLDPSDFGSVPKWEELCVCVCVCVCAHIICLCG